MSEDVNHSDTTVSELVDLIDRQKMALSEAGRPDLAEIVHVSVWPDGSVSLTYSDRHEVADEPTEVLKALSLDPVFKR